MGDGAGVMDKPLRIVARLEQRDGAVIGGHGLGELLLLAVQIARDDMDFHDIGKVPRKLTQHLRRRVRLAGGAQRLGAAQLGGVKRRMIARHAGL